MLSLPSQTHDVNLFLRDENLLISPDIDYSTLPGMSIEVRQRLMDHRPTTLGQAKRLEGVTPASLVSLFKHVRLGAKRAEAEALLATGEARLGM